MGSFFNGRNMLRMHEYIMTQGITMGNEWNYAAEKKGREQIKKKGKMKISRQQYANNIGN